MLLHLFMPVPVHSKQEVLKKLEEHKQDIKALGVSSLGLFGSFATGENIHVQSDVDFLVEFEPGKKPTITFQSVGISPNAFQSKG